MAAVSVWAQATGGSLTGRITNASGAAIANAAVTVTNLSSNASQRVLTGPDGSFTVSGLPPGTYRVDIESAGFKRTTQQNIELGTTGPVTITVALEAGSMNETVEIKGHAPMVSDTAEESVGLTTRWVREIPIRDRNYQELVENSSANTPPVAPWPMTMDPARNRWWSTNGQSPTVNMHQVDGVSNWEPFKGTAVRVQPAESIQQMNMATSNYTAEKGFTGGTWLATVTRPGTNDWHGSLFEFHSNNNLRARSFFNVGGNPDPKLVYNQFGGTVGGRVIRDKLFFFGSYEGTYDRGSNTQMTTLPTAAMRAGNFAGINGVTIFNPFTGSAATGANRASLRNNLIPANMLNTTSLAIANALPFPNQEGVVNNYVANAPYQHDGNKFDGRLDGHISDRTHAFLRYGYTNYRSVENSILGDIGAGSRSRLLAHNAVADIASSFTPNLVSDLRFGYNRYFNRMFPIGNNGLFPGNLPGINISGMSLIGTPAGLPMSGVDNTYNIAWNGAWHTSHHNVKFGVDLRHLRSDGFNNMLFGGSGSALFGPGGTLTNTATLSPLSSFANSFASFLLGAPSSLGTTAFAETPTYRQWQYAAFVGDTVQGFRRLNVDLGVRYEVYSPLEPRRAGGAMFFDQAFNTVNFAGTGDVGMHGTRWDLNNVAPRIGLAFRPTDRTSIRAGYAISYFQVPYMFSGFMPAMFGSQSGVAGGFTTVNGFGATLNSATAPASFTNGLTAPNIPLSVVPRDMKTPYVQSFNFNIQQDLGWATVFSIGYVGTLGRQLPYTQELNAAAPGTGFAGLPFAAFGRTASTTLYATGLNDNYNSLQVSLNKRFSHGLAFMGSYAWSKALGYTGANGFLMNPFELRSNYGPMDWDRQHVLTISHLWQLPFGAGTNHLNQGIVGQIVGNWQVNGVFTWATGTPFSVTADPLFCACPGMSAIMANVNGPVDFSNGIGGGRTFFATSAFTSPGAGRFGNLGRNALRGPSMKNYDLSLFRSFPIHDQFKLEFRGEAFNLTNTPRFNNPVTNLNAADFGMVTSTYNGSLGRQIDLAVRLLF